MRLKKIKTIEEGNKYLEEYIKEHNQKYAVAPAEEEEGHIPYRENLSLLKKVDIFMLQKGVTF